MAYMNNHVYRTLFVYMYIVYYCWVRQTTTYYIILLVAFPSLSLPSPPPLPSLPLLPPSLPSPPLSPPPPPLLSPPLSSPPPLPVQEYASVLRGRWSWETSVWSQRSAQCSGSVCSQWSRGPVRGLFPSWAYNRTTGQCEQFNYGGCLGNDNRFCSEPECDYVCGEW